MTFRALTALLLLSLACPLFAAEGELPVGDEEAASTGVEGEEATEGEDAEEEEVAESGADTGAEAQDGEAQVAVTTDETFIPSTQISEDLSVSFPVDI